MLIKSISVTTIMAGMFLMFKFSEEAGISGGVMASILSSVPITTAFMFYLVCGEKPHLRHYIGIVAMIIAVICIGFGSEPEKSNEVTSPTLSAWIPILFAIIACFFITVMNLMARLTTENGLTQFQFNSDGTLICGIYYLISFIVTQYFNSYSWQEFFPMAFLSILLVVGIIFINLAFAYGNAGISSAIF
mmetsp:Transcript_37972/g.27961  ORF Transcript_37972/g.27961 Transcript_37972/m.27961 type:complete len:190 (-) Transcript_37972:101-670(-)